MVSGGSSIIVHLHAWFLTGETGRMLDIGCGVAEEAEALTASGYITEFVGVDLDETAIEQARLRVPTATFHCMDAACLGPDFLHSFHTVLIRRPDLLAQPAHWQSVFAGLPQLLIPEGRVFITLIGEAESKLIHKWLIRYDFFIIHVETLPYRDECYLYVAEPLPLAVDDCVPEIQILEAHEGEGMFCDPVTGFCNTPGLLFKK